MAKKKRKHSHYFKNVAHLTHVDVYRVLALYDVTDQALAHAIKKLLVAGGRGVKDFKRDVQEAIDTLNRRIEMFEEDELVKFQDQLEGALRREAKRAQQRYAMATIEPLKL